MSGEKKPKDNSNWLAFAARHKNKSYSVTFNGLLDAVIADEDAPLFSRVMFWLIRHAWGNFSDWPVDFKTDALKKQVDAARDLKLTNAKGEPDRQKVNPVFQQMEKLGYIRFEGQKIILIDDPTEASFAFSSENVGPYRTNGGKSPSFQSYIDEVWASSHPAEYAEYQKTAQRYKELRTRMLSEFQTFKEQMSERGPTNENESPAGVGHAVGEGSDTASETDPTSARPIIIGSKPLKTVAKPSSSGSSSLVGEALNAHAKTDDDAANQLIAACRKIRADCTPEEIAHFVHEKAKLITVRTTNPAGLLLTAVPKCFEGSSFAAYRTMSAKAADKAREQTERLADELRAEARRQNSPEWLHGQIEACRESIQSNPQAAWVGSLKARIAEMQAKIESLRKPAESESHEKTMKAGQS